MKRVLNYSILAVLFGVASHAQPTLGVSLAGGIGRGYHGYGAGSAILTVYPHDDAISAHVVGEVQTDGTKAMRGGFSLGVWQAYPVILRIYTDMGAAFADKRTGFSIVAGLTPQIWFDKGLFGGRAVIVEPFVQVKRQLGYTAGELGIGVHFPLTR